MNILHISRRFCPCIGGTEKYIYDISTRLIKNEINCRVLTLNYDVLDRRRKFKKFEVIDGIEVYRIPGFGFYKKPIPLSFPLALFKWADIIHIHDVRFLYEMVLFLKPLLKYKIIMTTHGFILHTLFLNKIKSFISAFYYKPTFNKYIDWILCVSKQDYEYFSKMGLKNISLIENGIDLNKINDNKKIDIPGEFLYFGRIDENKGIDLLFKSLALVKDLKWNLSIVGRGPQKIVNDLKVLSKKLEILQFITWYGEVEESVLSKFLLKAHICFFPSTYEGFGFTLIEAMAYGNLCVANQIKPYMDLIINGENGFLAVFADSKKVAEMIRKLYKIPKKELKTITGNAKREMAKFNWDLKIEQIIKSYSFGAK